MAAIDFCGLNPNQMHELLQNPSNCPSVFKPLLNAEAVNQVLDTAPVIRMAKVLVASLEGKGICLTSKGNLPLKQVQKTAQARLAKKGWLTCFEPFRSCRCPPSPVLT